MRYVATIIAIPFILLFCSLSAYAQPAAATMPVVKIGAIYNLSGYEAPLGKKALQGSEVAVDWINHHGGVNGHPVQLIVKNSETQSTVAEKVATELAKNPDIKVIVGLTDDTRLASAMIPIAKYNKLFITSGSTSGKLAAAYAHNLILSCYTDTMQAEAAALFAANDLHAKNALLLSDTSSRYTINISRGFQQKFNALGDHIVANVKYDGAKLNIPNLIQQARHHLQDTKVIYLAANENSANIIQALRQAGFHQPILSGDGFDSDEIVNAPTPAMNNVYFTTHVVLDPATSRGIQRQFIHLYQQKYHMLPRGAFTALGFDSVMLATEALSKAKNDTTKDLREVLYNLKNFPSASSVFSFNNDNVPGKSIYIVKVVNHRRQLVKIVSDIKPLIYP